MLQYEIDYIFSCMRPIIEELPNILYFKHTVGHLKKPRNFTKLVLFTPREMLINSMHGVYAPKITDTGVGKLNNSGAMTHLIAPCCE